MSDLRKIIVNATSEMLDAPDEHGIYPTGKFYDRLENEVQEYMDQHPNPVNVHNLIVQTVEHSADIGVPLQAAIAKYIEYLSHPVMSIKPVNINLGKELE